MKKVILFISLFFSLTAFGQATLDGRWQLESISRNQKQLEFYNRTLDAAEGYPPVLWLIGGNSLAITGDLSVPATDPHAQDTVEAHHWALNGDTLILTQYYTKGLELATITNSEKTYYRLEQLTPTGMLLIMYDRYYDGSFRTIDVYSRRYVFSRQ